MCFISKYQTKFFSLSKLQKGVLVGFGRCVNVAVSFARVSRALS